MSSTLLFLLHCGDDIQKGIAREELARRAKRGAKSRERAKARAKARREEKKAAKTVSK